MKRVADTYGLPNVNDLTRMLYEGRQATAPRFLFYDKDSGEMMMIQAPDPDADESDDSSDEEEKSLTKPKNMDVAVTPPPGTSLYNGEVPYMQSPANVIKAMGDKTAGRDYHDNSNNYVNINQKIENSQRIQDQRVTHQL